MKNAENEIAALLLIILSKLELVEPNDPKRFQSAAICISKAIEYITEQYGITEEAIKTHADLNEDVKKSGMN